MQTQKTLEILSRAGITPNQILAEIFQLKIFIMETDRLCRIDDMPKIFCDQFDHLKDGFKNPMMQFGKYCKMDIMGWGRFDGVDVQMYSLDGGTWSFCPEKGSMLDRYLKALFENEEG